MSFGQQQSQGKPVFLPGQQDLAGQILMSVLAPMALGGAPDPGTEINNQRSRQNLNQTLAQQGLTGSGLAAKSSASLEQGLAANTANQRYDIVNRIFSPLGSTSKASGFNVGLGS